MTQKKRNNRRKKRAGFKPDQQYIEQAVANFLAGGGVIHRIESTERTFEEFMAGGNSSGLSDVDDFLNGAT